MASLTARLTSLIILNMDAKKVQHNAGYSSYHSSKIRCRTTFFELQ